MVIEKNVVPHDMSKEFELVVEENKRLHEETELYNTYLAAFSVFSSCSEMSADDVVNTMVILGSRVAFGIAADDIRFGRHLKTKAELVQAAEKLVPGKPGRISFDLGDKEVLRFEENGDIFIKGKKVDNDAKVVSSFKEWLREAINKNRGSRPTSKKRK